MAWLGRLRPDGRASWKCLAPVVCALLAAGCSGDRGPELVPVSGRVLLDGQPLTKGVVTTIPPQGRGAQAEIDDQGRFQLSTGDLGPGAIVGLHQVAVVATESSDPGNPEASTRFLAPERYSNPHSSGLTVDVSAGAPIETTFELSTK